MNDEDRVKEILQEAQQLAHGDMRVQLMDEAVKLADSLQNLKIAFFCRLQLMQAAVNGGRSERLMTAFSWCLAKYKETPELFEGFAYNLLWRFKWAVDAISTFPHVSHAEFHSLLNEMKEMYLAHGYGMRAVHYLHFRYYCDIGEFDRAAELIAEWQDSAIDDMKDCEACEIDSLVNYYADTDQAGRAVETAHVILSGEQSCMEVPHITYSTLLRSLAQLGRYDECDEVQAKDYRLIRRNPEFLHQVAEHIGYLTHRGNLTKAVALLEKHLAWIAGTFEQTPRYLFLTAAANLLTKLGDRKRLKLPAEFEKHDEGGEYDVADLAQWFQQERDELGATFDKRNGNDHYSRRLVEIIHYDGIEFG